MYEKNMKNKALFRSVAITGVLVLAMTAYNLGISYIITKPALSDEERLGKLIFEDTALSEPAGTSCASCHEADKAFQGNNHSSIAAVARGSKPKSIGTRNVPTLMYMAYSPPFSFTEEKNDAGEIVYTPTGGHFWDGRANSFAEQAAGPFLHKDEMNNPSKDAVVKKIAAASYAPLMHHLYGPTAFSDTEKAFAYITNALAAFQNTKSFAPFSSKFDAYLRGEEQLSTLEQKGFDLFKDPQKGNCISCHVGKTDSKNPQDWLFTDFTYDALGIPRHNTLPANKDASTFDPGLCKQPGIENKMPKKFPLGSLCGAFKVPTLRNSAITGPYMHNGFFTSLHDVVKFYATRDTHPEKWFSRHSDGSLKKFDDLPAELHGNINTDEIPYDRQPGEQPRLTEAEIDALVAFLNTLTDRSR